MRDNVIYFGQFLRNFAVRNLGPFTHTCPWVVVHAKTRETLLSLLSLSFFSLDLGLFQICVETGAKDTPQQSKESLL